MDSPFHERARWEKLYQMLEACLLVPSSSGSVSTLCLLAIPLTAYGPMAAAAAAAAVVRGTGEAFWEGNVRAGKSPGGRRDPFSTH